MVALKTFLTGLTAAALYAQTEAGLISGPPPTDCLLAISVWRPSFWPGSFYPGHEEYLKTNVEYKSGTLGQAFGFIEGYEWSAIADRNCQIVKASSTHPHRPVRFYSILRSTVTNTPPASPFIVERVYSQVKQGLKDWTTNLPYPYQ
ncbi:hypothetical protein PspLS_04309 [Pyricularia sp. CBS 133598]|nr:hypothetical protein PspLS_04309 [Pyricularia sp. CBS 133598]